MRLHAAVLLGLVIASAAQAQTKQSSDLPDGQTLLDGLTDKNQTASSEKAKLGETKEQHDHYNKNNPDDQPITNKTITNNTTNHSDDNE